MRSAIRKARPLATALSLTPLCARPQVEPELDVPFTLTARLENYAQPSRSAFDDETDLTGANSTGHQNTSRALQDFPFSGPVQNELRWRGYTCVPGCVRHAA